MLFERKSLNDVLEETPELRVNGDWLCLNIETTASWPTKPQPMQFEGHVLWAMLFEVSSSVTIVARFSRSQRNRSA